MYAGERMKFDDDEIKKLIGNKIKVYRQLRVKTTRDMFIEGVTEKYGTIENIEVGRSYPDLEFLVKISNKYHVPLKSFIDTGYRERKVSEDYGVFDGYSENEIYEILKQLDVEKYRVLRQLKVMDNMRCKGDISWGLYIESIGIYLYNERVKKNLSFENLSEMSGVAPKTIKNIESRNNTGISVKTLYRLCCALRIPIDYVLAEKLDDKSEAVRYMFTDIFWDADERERVFLRKYIKIAGEYRKLY